MDREIIEYDIIIGEDTRNLVRRVAESMKRGWVPQGGVVLGQGGFPMQAVVKFKSPNQ